MASIKKAYTEIVELLQANLEASVADVLPSVIELASAKAGGGGSRATTFHKNEDGEVVAIKCYYHGVWMSPAVVDFGKKASSATGFNNMCKEGVSNWTKQQAAAKKAKNDLLNQLAEGELAQEDLSAAIAKIEEDRDGVYAREDGYGFETLDECLADNIERGVAA